MKKSYVSMFLVAMLCINVGNAQSRMLKGVLDKATNAVGNVIKGKDGGNKSGSQDSKKNVKAKAAAPDVKNTLSDIRTLTGLTKADFEKKVKAMGYVESTDDTGGMLGGGIVYKSKAKGASLTYKLGTRGGESLTLEVSKYIYSKKPDIAAMKESFLGFGNQCVDLKAELDNASVEETGKMFSKVMAKNAATRTSKFLPALDGMITAKKEFSAAEFYDEQDYGYRSMFYFIKVTGAAVFQITVTDKTVDSLEG